MLYQCIKMFLPIIISASVYANDPAVFFRSFWDPKYHGLPLAYCNIDDAECGNSIALAYCNMMGYQGVQKQLIAHNVGLTHYINNQGQCKGWRCDGFKLITCRGKWSKENRRNYQYRMASFAFPRYEHYRVDWCYEKGKSCGARAAYSFCRRMGYDSAQAYEKQNHVPATRSLGDHQLCFGNQCHGFSKIICYR